jgi:hypothetical protein
LLTTEDPLQVESTVVDGVLMIRADRSKDASISATKSMVHMLIDLGVLLEMIRYRPVQTSQS